MDLEDKSNKLGDPYLIKVPLAPRPASRPRFSSKGQVYNDATYKKWLTDFTEIVRRDWEFECFAKVSHIEVTFNGPTKRGDLDNYLKAALDGLVYSRVLRSDNLTVLDSIQTQFIRIVGTDPWILFTIYH